MPTEEPKQKGYEVRDAPTSPVAIGLVVLIALMLGGFVGGKMFQAIFTATEVRSRPAPEPLVEREQVEGPTLQAHPEVEVDAYVASERARLQSYGWVDRSAGVVHIPIELAMELVVRDGLPKWEPVEAKLPERPEPIPSPAEGETGTPDDDPFTGTESLPD